jgi:hypothetical protein
MVVIEKHPSRAICIRCHQGSTTLKRKVVRKITGEQEIQDLM